MGGWKPADSGGKVLPLDLYTDIQYVTHKIQHYHASSQYKHIQPHVCVLAANIWPDFELNQDQQQRQNVLSTYFEGS